MKIVVSVKIETMLGLHSAMWFLFTATVRSPHSVKVILAFILKWKCDHFLLLLNTVRLLSLTLSISISVQWHAIFAVVKPQRTHWHTCTIFHLPCYCCCYYHRFRHGRRRCYFCCYLQSICVPVVWHGEPDRNSKKKMCVFNSILWIVLSMSLSIVCVYVLFVSVSSSNLKMELARLDELVANRVITMTTRLRQRIPKTPRDDCDDDDDDDKDGQQRKQHTQWKRSNGESSIDSNDIWPKTEQNTAREWISTEKHDVHYVSLLPFDRYIFWSQYKNHTLQLRAHTPPLCVVALDFTIRIKSFARGAHASTSFRHSAEPKWTRHQIHRV